MTWRWSNQCSTSCYAIYNCWKPTSHTCWISLESQESTFYFYLPSRVGPWNRNKSVPTADFTSLSSWHKCRLQRSYLWRTLYGRISNKGGSRVYFVPGIQVAYQLATIAGQADQSWSGTGNWIEQCRVDHTPLFCLLTTILCIYQRL